MESLTIKIDCQECGGEGTVEVGPVCFKPASMCCGGCYQTHKCEDCDGVGYKEVESSDVDLYDLVERYIKDYSRMAWSDCKLTMDDDYEFVTLRYQYWKQLTDEQIKSINLPEGVKIVLDTYVDDDGETEDGRTIYRYLYSYKISFENGNVEANNQESN